MRVVYGEQQFPVAVAAVAVVQRQQMLRRAKRDGGSGTGRGDQLDVVTVTGGEVHCGPQHPRPAHARGPGEHEPFALVDRSLRGCDLVVSSEQRPHRIHLRHPQRRSPSKNAMYELPMRTVNYPDSPVLHLPGAIPGGPGRGFE